MTKRYYQKHKERSEKKHVKYIKIFLQKKRAKGEKSPKKDIKILLKKKKKKGVSIIRNLSKSYLSIEEIII